METKQTAPTGAVCFVSTIVVIGGTLAPFFKPEKNLDFFRLKKRAIDASPGRLE